MDHPFASQGFSGSACKRVRLGDDDVRLVEVRYQPVPLEPRGLGQPGRLRRAARCHVQLG